MDTFLGKWKGGPGDFENHENYFKDLKLPELINIYAQGMEMTFAKEGDDYSSTAVAGGVPVLKQIFCPGGVVKNVNVPEGANVELTYRVEGTKMIVEGTYAGAKVCVTQYVEDGKLIAESKHNDAWMKVRLTKV